MNNSMAKMILQLSAFALLLCGCDFFDHLHKPASGEASTTNSVLAETTGLSGSKLFRGQTIESVQQILGKPDGTMTSDTRTILLYSGETLEFIGGKLANAKPDVQERIEASKKARAKQAKEALSNLKKTADTKATPAIAAATQTPAAKSGTSLYSDLIVPGKITVVDFYATWCGPCTQLAPILDSIVSGQSDVTLRKVDIVDWGSSVAKKYNITSVPNVRVFDKKGQMVGSPTSNPNQIAQYIEQAKQSR